MELRKSLRVGNKTIFVIALAITVFINIKRLITLVYPNQVENLEFTHVSSLDLAFRVFWIFLLNLFLLQFNVNWKHNLKITHPLKGQFITGSINLIIAVLFLFAFIQSYQFFFKLQFIDKELYTLYFGWAILLISNLLTVQVLQLQLNQKVNLIEKERLIQEKISNELNTLKSQVNPHFLFNSLNTLNGIIRKTPEKATLFVDELSFMYRYILQSGSKGLVKVEEELIFLNSYIYIVNQRFGKNIDFNIDLNSETKRAFIPILALQIVVENAIKHNEISDQNPLIISIQYTKEKEIVISNKIALRTHVGQSTGNGLSNLSQRYHLLLNMDISIQKNNTFTVHLPISFTNLEL